MIIKELSCILWLVRDANRPKAAAREVWTSNPACQDRGGYNEVSPGSATAAEVRKSVLFPERDLQAVGGHDVRLVIPSCKICHQVA